ncbi:hypothetical protein EDB84DRAFT_1559396 [Lactarius hengduanensis]|nr:hypothetical protein EDB84DRAFT_1559396 [Lactarius hengduanensis]
MKPEPEPENKLLPPNVGHDWDGAARIHSNISNAPSSPALQQVQAQLAALMVAVAGGNSGGVTLSPIIVVGVPVPVPAHRGPRTTDSTMTTTDSTATTTNSPSPPTLSHQQLPTLTMSAL